MYINDVIRFVQKHYPSEYSPTDMYKWCDEVSAMLLVEDRISYKEATLPVFPDGYVLLNEDVCFENVVSVYADGRRLEKRDVRTTDKRFYPDFPDEHLPDCVTFVYSVPFKPIRLVKYTGSSEICPTIGGEQVPDSVKVYNLPFIKGDSVLFITDGGEKYGPCHILDVTPFPDELDAYLLHFGEGDITEDIEELSDPVIMRYITDQTVCAAPFDIMYEDYVLAQICYHQHDQAGYNQHISNFNNRLRAYKKWLVDKLPYDRGKFINYW